MVKEGHVDSISIQTWCILALQPGHFQVALRLHILQAHRKFLPSTLNDHLYIPSPTVLLNPLLFLTGVAARLSMSFAAAGMAPWQRNTNFPPPPPLPGTAYIPVSARQSFANFSVPPPPPPPGYVPPRVHAGVPVVPHQPQPTTPSGVQARKKVEWPPGTRDYVQRSFAVDNQIPGVQKPDIEARLKQVITEITQGQRLYSTDWKTLPLPQQMIVQERTTSAPGIASPPSWIAPPPVLTGPHLPGPMEYNIRKRKSNEMSSETDDMVSTPPWRTNKAHGSLEDRISFVPTSEKRPKVEANMSKSQANLDHRRKRFEDSRSGSNSPKTSMDGAKN